MLVHQEHLRIAHHGAADGDALTLTAGKRFGLPLKVLGDIQYLGDLFDLLFDIRLGRLAELERKGKVIIDGHVGIQRVVLENHRYIAVLRRYVVHKSAVDVKLAVRDLFKACDHSESGGFSASGGTHQHYEFLVLDLEVYVMYSSNLVVVDLFQSFQNHF